MTEKFHEELKLLTAEVEKMGALAKYMIENSVTALKDRNVELAKEIISKKRELADLDEMIEEEALKLIALHQPMAGDMRTIACVMKMNTYIARIGRYGNDIAKVAIDLANEEHIAKLVSLPQMAKIVCGMIDDSLKAFQTRETVHIKDFLEREDTVDAMRYSIFREGISYMMEDPKYITRGTHYIMIARYLERCADHACKMAEKIHFMVTGERIEIK
jgi:phosphate transport system protein